MSNKNSSVTAKRVTQGFVSYLKKSQQMGLLPHVARETLKLTKTATDPNTAYVQSAIKLNQEQIVELESSLSQTYGRQITVENSVNPDLIAGITIKVGDQVIDQSFNHQIEKLEQVIQL